jgi:type II secretory ATPase GspE/PulE/Tfp pilus assembly ATPase PilB-like protein
MGTKDGLMGRFLGNAEKFTEKQVAETLDLLVSHGLQRGASDIHIEPHDRFVLVRYRIDGTLRGVHKLPHGALEMVMTELKNRAALRMHDANLPQEGHYDLMTDGRQATVNVATMPVYGGEKAVLHLSLQASKPRELEVAGFWGDGLKTLQSVLATPHGLVTVAGPRHNGVASTLFSLLDLLNSPMVSIATVESHAKHRLQGVSQTYLSASGMNFHAGLQAALKQDPNIIMLSDLPDAATAELAIHAATTGHLVLVGIHAEGAIAAALRMRVAGIEPFLLATGLRVTVGQRLVRRLCAACRERRPVTAEEQHILKHSFGVSTTATHKRLHELEAQAAAGGMGDPKQLNTSGTSVSHLWRKSTEGCHVCDHTGYNGQIALVEVLANTENVQKGILDRDIASVPAMQKLAIKDDFIPMALDGLVKALRGQTDIQEVLQAAHVRT